MLSRAADRHENLQWVEKRSTSQHINVQEALASKVEVQRQLAEFEADASTLQAQLQAQGTDLQQAQGEAALLRKQLDWANNQLADAEDKARSATAAAQRTALVVSPALRENHGHPITYSSPAC